jgi:hypothetical protein
METLAFLLLVTMQRNNTGVVSVSMELFDYGYLVTTRVLHINDGLRSNTSQYLKLDGESYFSVAVLITQCVFLSILGGEVSGMNIIVKVHCNTQSLGHCLWTTLSIF